MNIIWKCTVQKFKKKRFALIGKGDLLEKRRDRNKDLPSIGSFLRGCNGQS